MGSKCNCQKPPGGGTECPDGTFAVCRMKNGECLGQCIPLEVGIFDRQQLNNFILGIVKNESRTRNQPLTAEDQSIISTQRHITTEAGTRVIITFSIPDDDELPTFGMKLGVLG
jgi:hypothetical protein